MSFQLIAPIIPHGEYGAVVHYLPRPVGAGLLGRDFSCLPDESVVECRRVVNMDIEIRCIRCGNIMSLIVYPTNPPQTGYRCLNCGHTDDGYCTPWKSDKIPKQIIYR
jgi:hypothetical protein